MNPAPEHIAVASVDPNHFVIDTNCGFPHGLQVWWSGRWWPGQSSVFKHWSEFVDALCARLLRLGWCCTGMEIEHDPQGRWNVRARVEHADYFVAPSGRRPSNAV